MQRRKETSMTIEAVRVKVADRRGNSWLPAALLRIFLLVLSAFGSILWMVSMLEMEISMQMVLWSILLSALWFYMVFCSRWKMRYTIPATVTVLILWGADQRDALTDGAGQFLNYLSDKIRGYYGQGIGFFDTENLPVNLEELVCLVSVLMVFLLAYGIFRRQKTGILTYLFAILLCASMSIDSFPHIAAFMMLMSAWLAMRAMGGRQRSRGMADIQWKAGILMLAAGFLALVVGYLWISPPVEKRLVENHDTIMKFQSNLEMKVEDFLLSTPFSGWDVFSGFTWQGKVESGELTNSSPGRTGRTALTLQLDVKPEDNIYLRGFIGGIYEGDRWTEISEEDFDETVENQWNLDLPGNPESSEYAKETLLNTGYQGAQILAAYMGKERYMGTGILDLKEVNGKYGYLPYCIDTDSVLYDQADVRADGETIRKKDKLTFEGYFGSFYMDLRDRGIFFSPSDQTQLQISQAYRSYVRQHYLYVPVEGTERLRDYCQRYLLEAAEQGVDLNMNFIVESVRQMLAQQCSYSLDLSPLPAGKDYTEYFFFDQKKGFCTHFASTAVLMYRMYGIPARYATGYVVRPGEFTVGEKRTYVAEVPDGNAHAWVEIYDERVGWVPVEVTPGYQTEKRAPVGTEDGEDIKLPATVTPKPETTAEPSAEPTVTPETVENPPVGGVQAPDSVKVSAGLKRFWSVVAVILCVLLALAFVMAVLVLRRIYIKKMWNRKISGKRRKNALTEISYAAYGMLRSAGYPLQGGSDEEYARKVQKSFPVLAPGEFQQFVELARRAKFSREVFSQEDIDFCMNVYRKLERNIYQSFGAAKKFWWRFIKCF